METVEQEDIRRVEKIVSLLEEIGSRPIGDLLIEAVNTYEGIELDEGKFIAEEALKTIRKVANQVDPSLPFFSNPVVFEKELTEKDYIQILRIVMSIHELCYSLERMEESAKITWGGSTSTRFYLNSFYHYTSSLFLIDKSKPSHKGLIMGGQVVRVLQPLGLKELLIPLMEVLNFPFGNITYGTAILNIRHSDLVHGDFSPERFEWIVRDTQMRDPVQQMRFRDITWKFFHRLFIFYFRLFSILVNSGKDPITIMNNYIDRITKN